jgi:hypothetical protein
MTEESLIASRVFGRKLEKPPITWPAFAVTAVVGVAVTVGYSVGVLGLLDGPLDISNLINTRFLYSIVPCALISLGLWALLYFGFVRWRNATLGPTYFNSLAIIVFTTSLLAPLGLYGVRSVERQVAEAKVRQEWSRAPALKGELATIARDARSADLAAWNAIAAEIREADVALDMAPSTLASQAIVDARRARIGKASKDLKAYHRAYGQRLDQTHAAVTAALARNKAPPLVMARVRPLLDEDTRNARAARESAYAVRQLAYGEALDALDILAAARGTWKSDGQRLLFYREGVLDRLLPEVRQAAQAQYRLRYVSDKASSPMLWSRPPPGV